MKDTLAETCVCDDGADGVVDFVAVNCIAGLEGPVDRCNCRIACPSDDGEDAAGGWGRFFTAECCPGDVGVAVGRTVALFGPQIDQEHIAGSDRAVLLGAGRVVREGCVAVDGHDGIVIPRQFGSAKLFDNELLHRVLGDLLLLTQGLGDKGEGRVLGRQNMGGGATVAVHLLGSEHSLDKLYEVSAADDVCVGCGAHHFEGSGVYVADVGDSAIGAVFHGDPAVGSLWKNVLQLLLQLLPTDIEMQRSGHFRADGAESGLLDRMDEPLRLALGRYPEKPAARAGGFEPGD